MLKCLNTIARPIENVRLIEKDRMIVNATIIELDWISQSIFLDQFEQLSRLFWKKYKLRRY